ncbi:MAG: hypothetical protein ACRC1P_09580 [Cellulosilyticaceae bacterium]
MSKQNIDVALMNITIQDKERLIKELLEEIKDQDTDIYNEYIEMIKVMGN